jgi:hypothetical protein
MVNRLCLEEAMKGASVPEMERTVLRAVLGNHRIDYGEDYEDLIEAFTQQNGQLMGCPLSFPILCAINVAAYWCALEEHTGRRFRLDQLPVLVNGDDICFRANDEFYKTWQKWIKKVGFTLSPGKNYISADFVTINSEGFIFQPASGKRSHRFTPVGFLNTGLLYQGKSCRQEIQSGTEKESGLPRRPKVGMRPENREAPFTSILNRIITESCNPRRSLLRVHKLFRDEISYHTMCGEINMHADPALGGLGIVLPSDCKTTFTSWQQRVAGFLRSRFRNLDFGKELMNDLPWVALEGHHRGRIIDLNQNLGVEGRLTYRKKAACGLRYLQPVSPGQVVVRDKMEPLREGEKRIELVVNRPLNYQGASMETHDTWGITQLSPQDIIKAREYRGEKVLKPLYHNLEVRITQSEKAQFVQELYRSDSNSIMSWADSKGNVHSFLTKPLMLAGTQ